MPRIDDYKQALDFGKRGLLGENPDHVARFSGAVLERGKQGTASLFLPFLNRAIVISWPHLEFSYRESPGELPIQQQILLLHYLYGAWSSKGAAITGEWISFQEVPEGRFYLEAFHRRAKNPMLQTFGHRPELLAKLSKEAFGATSLDQGDVSVAIKALPLVLMSLIIWKGDQEFPPEGNILFDRNILEIFSAEDMAWLAGMVIYPLMGMVKGQGEKGD